MSINKTSLDSIVDDLNKDCTNPKQLSQEELEAYRLQLALIKKLVGAKMAETGTKDHLYNEADIIAYIDNILVDGFNLQETELSDYPEFVDAQRLKRWSSLIAERVELSMFGTKQFKIYSLRLLRSNIAKSKTLHELRQAVTLMISPLDLWNEHLLLVQKCSPKQMNINNKENDAYLDSVLSELEDATELLKERDRVISYMLDVYKDGAEDLVILRNCESAKKQHNLSDTQAAELFNISRKKLLRLREDYTINPLKVENELTPILAKIEAKENTEHETTAC